VTKIAFVLLGRVIAGAGALIIVKASQVRKFPRISLSCTHLATKPQVERFTWDCTLVPNRMKTRAIDGYNGSDISVFANRSKILQGSPFLQWEAKTPPSKNVVLEDELNTRSRCEL
jgi:hypothetical protein